MRLVSCFRCLYELIQTTKTRHKSHTNNENTAQVSYKQRKHGTSLIQTTKTRHESHTNNENTAQVSYKQRKHDTSLIQTTKTRHKYHTNNENTTRVSYKQRQVKFYLPFITSKYNINMIFINTVIVFVGYLCKVDTCTALPLI
jgi:hypothetical protein